MRCFELRLGSAMKSASEKPLTFCCATSKRKEAPSKLPNERRLVLLNKTFHARQFSSSATFATKLAGSTQPDAQLTNPVAKPNITYKHKLVSMWNNTDVTDWAREDLGLSEDAITFLKEQDYSGQGLLLIKSQDLDFLINKLKFPSGAAEILWQGIQNFPESYETYNFSYIPKLVKEWQSLSCHQATKTLGSRMPIEERKEEVARMWETLVQHYESWKRGEQEGKHHQICFAYGPPGSGKTKFGGELIQLLKDHGNQLVQNKKATKEEVEFLEILQNSIFICISFAGENQMLPDEKFYLETALVIRGIKSLFGLKETPSELMAKYGDKIYGWTFTDTLMNVAVKYCASDTTKPRMVYIHVDELNQLHDVNPNLFRDVVLNFALPLFYTREEMFYTLLMSTTSYTEATLVNAKIFSSNPIVRIPMTLLSTEGIINVVKRMRVEGHLKWLNPNWEENTPFLLSLMSTGGLPIALESLLESIEKRISRWEPTLKAIRNLEDVCDINAEEMMERYDKSWTMPSDLSARVFADGILGTPIDLDIRSDVDYVSLLKNGSIVLKKIDGCWWRIHFPSPWLKHYSQLYEDFMPPQLYRELVSVEPTTWCDWEKLTSTMLMLRTNAFRLKNVLSYYLKELFPNSTLLGTTIRNWELRPIEKFQIKKIKFDLHNLATNAGKAKWHPFETGKIWVNGVEGQCVDAWTVLERAQHHTVVFVKNAFGAKDSPLYTQTVIDTYLTLENLWNNLQTKEGLDLTAYRFALVVVSNCQLEVNHVRNSNDRFYLETKKQLKPEQTTGSTVKMSKKKQTELDALNKRVLSNCIVYDADTVESFFSTFSTQALFAFSNEEIVKLRKEKYSQ